MKSIGITLGEPAGIGPEVTVAALCSPRIQKLACHFLLYGPLAVYEAASKALARAGKNPASFSQAVQAGQIGFAPIPLEVECTPGVRAAAHEPAVLASIRSATQDALQKKIHAVVTAPIDKRALFHQGFPGWGHTEYLAHLTGAKTPTMVLVSQPTPEAHPLRVALVTNHVPLRNVPQAFNGLLLMEKARVLHQGLQALGIERPKLAVAGFNPHAGEQGELGDEESVLIEPAILKLQSQGIRISGPFSADTVFLRGASGEFDAVLAPYHDQGMIAVKMYGFGHGVNWTLGLPIIRTSPDHGTAYNLAGTGLADPTSMIEAILLAESLSVG